MTVNIGSVSTATLRDQDLLEAFSGTLGEYDDGTYADLIAEANKMLSDWDDDDEPAAASEVVNDLQDALNTFAPDYMYFGSHPGDGSDFGFWIDTDAIDDAIHDGDLLKVDDLDNIPADHNGMVVVVNDHGNMALYKPEITYAEVWAIV